MYIETNIMAEVVGEQCGDGLVTVSYIFCGAKMVDSYVARQVKSKLLQLVFQTVLGNAV